MSVPAAEQHEQPECLDESVPVRIDGPAAGSVEAILTILALRDGVAPPTINLDNPSPGCDLNYVPHQAQERVMRHALSNSFGFGGTNGSLIFSQLG